LLLRYALLLRFSRFRADVRSSADVRERDGGVADITLEEQVEEIFMKVLKILSF
jgi:hypothetical protein